MKRIPIPAVAALLAILLTATAALAARPQIFPAPRLAAEATASIVADETDPPTAAPTEAPTASASDEAPEASESAEPSETPEASDEDGAGSPSAHPSNHGSVVSTAAQASTPSGCKNHGEYVSLVARGLVDPNASPAPDASGSVCDAAPSHGPKAPEASEPPSAGQTPVADRHGGGSGKSHGKGHGSKR